MTPEPRPWYIEAQQDGPPHPYRPDGYGDCGQCLGGVDVVAHRGAAVAGRGAR